jgi:hypothetical protein
MEDMKGWVTAENIHELYVLNEQRVQNEGIKEKSYLPVRICLISKITLLILTSFINGNF